LRIIQKPTPPSFKDKLLKSREIQKKENEEKTNNDLSSWDKKLTNYTLSINSILEILMSRMPTKG
jgi:hypothetical protein